MPWHASAALYPPSALCIPEPRRRPDGKWRKQKAGSKAYSFGGWAAFAAGNIMRFIAMRFAAQTVLSGLGSLQVGAPDGQHVCAAAQFACRCTNSTGRRTALCCFCWLPYCSRWMRCWIPLPHRPSPAGPQFVIIPIASRFMLGIRASTSTVVGVTVVLLGEWLGAAAPPGLLGDVCWPLHFRLPTGWAQPAAAAPELPTSHPAPPPPANASTQATCSSFCTAPRR